MSSQSALETARVTGLAVVSAYDTVAAEGAVAFFFNTLTGTDRAGVP